MSPHEAAARKPEPDDNAPIDPLDSTALLIARVQEGDEQARNRLAARYHAALLRWTHGRIPARARGRVDTADVVQSALRRGFAHLDEFEHRREGAFMAYIRQILLNRIRDEARRVPISGAIKSTLPRIAADARNLGVLGLATWAIAAAGIAGLLLGRGSPARRLVVGSAAVGVLLHGLYVILFTDHNTHWSWYYVPGTILAAVLTCALADTLAGRLALVPRRVVAIALIALLTAFGLIRGWVRYVNSRASSHNQFALEILPSATVPRWEIQFADHMNRVLPAGTAVLVFDYPGHFAFYSSLHVIPSDGLVGDYRYDEELRRRGLSGYLATHGVEHDVGPSLSPPDSCRLETIFAPVEALDVGALNLCPENVVATSTAVVQDVPEPNIALFRIRDTVGPRGTPPRPMLKHGMLW